MLAKRGWLDHEKMNQSAGERVQRMNSKTPTYSLMTYVAELYIVGDSRFC